MKRIFQHIYLLLFLFSLFLSSCGEFGEKVIPRSHLSKIYAEILLTDQWIYVTPGASAMADTTLVYEPILMKYGYTSEDYRHTVDKYLDDPERFARILRNTSQILEKRIAELKKIRDRMNEESKPSEYAVEFKLNDCFPYMYAEPFVHYYDSLEVVMDTLTNAYSLKAVEIKDTLYDRIQMLILSDTSTVAAPDTLKSASVKQIKVHQSLRQLVKDNEFQMKPLERKER